MPTQAIRAIGPSREDCLHAHQSFVHLPGRRRGARRTKQPPEYASALPRCWDSMLFLRLGGDAHEHSLRVGNVQLVSNLDALEILLDGCGATSRRSLRDRLLIDGHSRNHEDQREQPQRVASSYTSKNSEVVGLWWADLDRDMIPRQRLYQAAARRLRTSPGERELMLTARAVIRSGASGTWLAVGVDDPNTIAAVLARRSVIVDRIRLLLDSRILERFNVPPNV